MKMKKGQDIFLIWDGGFFKILRLKLYLPLSLFRKSSGTINKIAIYATCAPV